MEAAKEEAVPLEESKVRSWLEKFVAERKCILEAPKEKEVRSWFKEFASEKKPHMEEKEKGATMF